MNALRSAIGATVLLAASCGAAGAVPNQVSNFPFNGTIAAAGTFQQLLPLNTSRAGCTIYNSTASDTLQVYMGPATTQAIMTAQALPIPPGQYGYCPLTDGAVIQSPVWLTGPTSGDAYRGAEQR